MLNNELAEKVEVRLRKKMAVTTKGEFLKAGPIWIQLSKLNVFIHFGEHSHWWIRDGKLVQAPTAYQLTLIERSV
jgi:hypothetical protein